LLVHDYNVVCEIINSNSSVKNIVNRWWCLYFKKELVLYIVKMMPCEEENVVDIGHLIQASMNMHDAHLTSDICRCG
jgi:hypothetical protein